MTRSEFKGQHSAFREFLVLVSDVWAQMSNLGIQNADCGSDSSVQLLGFNVKRSESGLGIQAAKADVGAQTATLASCNGIDFVLAR